MRKYLPHPPPPQKKGKSKWIPCERLMNSDVHHFMHTCNDTIFIDIFLYCQLVCQVLIYLLNDLWKNSLWRKWWMLLWRRHIEWTHVEHLKALESNVSSSGEPKQILIEGVAPKSRLINQCHVYIHLPKTLVCVYFAEEQILNLHYNKYCSCFSSMSYQTLYMFS